MQYGDDDVHRARLVLSRLLAIGLNCALGAALMRPYMQELNRVAGDTFINCYPNAGLPNPMSDTGFDETSDVTLRLLREFADEGLVNIVGGCCGTTPEPGRLLVERPGMPSKMVEVAAIAQHCLRGARDCGYVVEQMLLVLRGS